MKKRNLILLTALSCMLCVPATAYAGDINSAEQGILGAIAQPQEYNGKYYQVTDGYRAKVSEYLSQDGVDMSQGEADNYLAQFYANIGTGISSGYMAEVEVDNSAAENGADTGSAGNGTGSTGGSGTKDKTDSNTEEKQDGSNGTEGDGSTGTDGSSSAGGNTPGAASLLPGTPEKDAQGNVVDNTTGSTQSGALEYTVIPMEGTMYVWDTEKLEVHAEAYKDSEVIGSFSLGDKVSVTGGATTGWAQVDLGGKTGYVSAVYLRTDGYMRDQGVDVPDEDAEKKAVEEAARKAEEEKKKAEEEAAREAEEAAQAEEAAAAQAEVKDYSDAKAPARRIDLGVAAAVIVVILLAASAAVVLVHRNKKR